MTLHLREGAGSIEFVESPSYFAGEAVPFFEVLAKTDDPALQRQQFLHQGSFPDTT
jgi:hypothetical protein